MPKGTSPIKWRKSDKAKLAQRVRVFNAKRTRLIKQVPELSDILPEKASVSAIKERIYSRADFNKAIARLNRFMVPGASDVVTTKSGVVTTKYQIREMHIQKAQINRKRAQIRKLHPDDYFKGIMGTVKGQNLRPKKVDPQKVSKVMWDDVVKNLEAQFFDSYYARKDELYKKNYIRAVKDAYGEGAARDVIDVLEDMDSSLIADMYFYDPNLQIDFHYPMDEQEAEANLDFFKESLNEYFEHAGLSYALGI